MVYKLAYVLIDDHISQIMDMETLAYVREHGVELTHLETLRR
jgi:hypothetical protein